MSRFRSTIEINVRRNSAGSRQRLFGVALWQGGVGVTVAAPAQADNPIIQTLYTADPAPVVHDGTVYLYTSHDEDVTVNEFFTMNDWRLCTSHDIVNWRDHGSPLSFRGFSWSSGDAWAPHVVPRNGKWYFHVWHPRIHRVFDQPIAHRTV